MYDKRKELNRELNISSIGRQLKASWQVVADKEAGREWHDSTAKQAMAMQARTRTEMCALHLQHPGKALDEATRRGDEGFWSPGSVGSWSC